MPTITEIIILVLLSIAIVLLIILLSKSGKSSNNNLADELSEELYKVNEINQKQLSMMGDQLKERSELASKLQEEQFDHFSEIQKNTSASELQMIDRMEQGVSEKLETIYKRMESMEQSNKDNLEKIRDTMHDSIHELRDENSKKLDEIKGTVDEKLQTTLEKRISESFKTVSDQLSEVYKGLGEMQTLANDVGGLKKVLSGVKTRGILGEYQAAALISEILSPEQYDTNVATVPGSTDRVEFAVKLPGSEGTVYLPIDSKFPGERYQQLLDAQDTCDKALIEQAYKNLETVIKQEAKDIKEKYIAVPYTTNFGIMFLPFEGLYSEVVNRGLLELLQKEYKINVAGPSTLAALLNSLQMGFKTLAIQKKSAEVWTTLADVKNEFGKFEDTMKKMQTHLNQTTSDLDNLMGTRTRAIQRKLRGVEEYILDDADPVPMLADNLDIE